MSPVAATRAPRSPLVAAALSFIWPGLGQLYVGRRRDAILFGVPALAVAVVVLGQLAGGLTGFAIKLLDPTFALSLVIVVAIFGIWRLASILEAGAFGRGRSRAKSVAVLTALTAAVVGMHGVAGYYGWSFYQADSQIFVGGSGVDGPVGGLSASGSPEPTDAYNVAPFATESPNDPRITVLLTGIDKNEQRDHSLTDTMLVASIEPTTGKASMVSFPRDLTGVPLYNGKTFNGKINALMEYAAAHPADFPDGPLPTLAHELSYLLGIPINYFAAVDLDGFQQLIDAVGGVDIVVNRAIADSFYDWLDGSPRGFYLAAGPQHLDGRTALAYVRSRHGIGDSDFTRAARQQQLLVALKNKLTTPAMLGRLPQLLAIAARTIRTNFPPDQLDGIIKLAQLLDGSAITKVVLQPPTYSFHPPSNTTNGVYTLTLRWFQVKQLSVKLFGQSSAFWGTVPLPSSAPKSSPAPSPSGP